MRAESETAAREVADYDGSMAFTLEQVRDSLVQGEIHFFTFVAENDIGLSEHS